MSIGEVGVDELNNGWLAEELAQRQEEGFFLNDNTEEIFESLLAAQNNSDRN